MKYIQSFYQYPVTFSSIGKTIPSSLAQGEMKNIAEVTEAELETLKNCEPRFRELVNMRLYRVLNHIPASYVPPAEQINNAHAEADKLKAENEALKAKLAELEKQQEVKEEAENPATEEETVAEEKPAASKKTSSNKKK